MYLETYSMEELMELIEEKGYCSVEAVEILKEMEQAKKEYDFLLRDCKEKAWKTDQVVVDYYRYLLEELRKALPYDDSGIARVPETGYCRKNQEFYRLSGWVF